MMFNKKSQAALEFLTTYGWAFLVILIMISALAYFGILNPSGLLPDRCNFGSEIGCVDYTIGLDTLSLRLKNGVGESIKIEEITIDTESAAAYTCTGSPSLTDWGTGDVQDFAWTGCTGAAVGQVAGEKSKVAITIKYYLAKSSAAYSHEVAGEVSTTVTI